MPDFLTFGLSMVIMLGVLILVHEVGHFLAARAFGVRVDIFSVGFGPRVWGRRRGPTDYRISLLPLGGYVKMAGDNPTEERTGGPDEFLSKPRWQRAVIALAGPVMNILAAYILIVLLFGVIGMPYPAYLDLAPEVAGVGLNSPAAKEGIQPGDRIVDVNGVLVSNWKEALQQLNRVPRGGEASVRMERDGQFFSVTYQPRSLFDPFDSLGYPNDPVTVDDVSPRMPAALSGLRPGDQIVALNGVPTVSWVQVLSTIRRSNGQPIVFELLRGSEHLSITVKPVWGRNELGENSWLVGLRQKQTSKYERLGMGESLVEAADRCVRMSGMIFGVVGQLVTGRASLRDMQGVIGIGREAGQAAKRGLPDFVHVMAIISMNLAILNLLPIPILDGGHILLLAIEGVRRKDFSLAVKERFVQVGMVFLLVIFVIVTYNDVLRVFLRK